MFIGVTTAAGCEFLIHNPFTIMVENQTASVDNFPYFLGNNSLRL
jgi:hypothetical protein